jgi:hypothetical protein
MKYSYCVPMMAVAMIMAAWGVFAAHAPAGPPAQAARAVYGAWVFLDADSARSALPALAVSSARAPLDSDRPVNPELVARIAATGAHVRMVSRWLRAVAVDADSATLGRIREMPPVTGIAPIRSALVADGGRVAAPEGEALAALRFSRSRVAVLQDTALYGATAAALAELNIPVLHTLGFTGNGVRVGILDTGFFLSHESLAGRRVMGQFDFINRVGGVGPQPGDPPGQTRHGTAVMSLLGGFAPGRLVGGAYSAFFYLAKVKLAGELDYRGDEDRWVEAIEWADAQNVRVVNSSVGFRDRFADRENIPYGDLDGNTTVTTRMADEAARRGMLVVVAMGNSGPQGGTLWAPADGDSVLSVGAIDSLTATRAAVPLPISSRGPTADGRTKPELSARGARMTAASATGITAYEGNLTGSSYAAPFISAGAALFMEAWPNLSAMAVRQALILAGPRVVPDNVVGYGVPDVAAAVMFPEGIVLSSNSLSSMDPQRNLTTIVPRFSWFAPLIHPSMRPIRYTVEVARDSQFQQIVYTESIEETFQHTALRPLPPMDRAWWRVVARSPQGIVRRTLPQPSFRVPAWVRLLTLNEGEAVFTSDARPQLDWAPLAAPAPIGPFTYDVQVISVATNQVVQQVRNLGTASVRVPEPLTPNQAYRWRVIARTQGGAADTVQSNAPFVYISDEAPPATILYQNFPNPFPNFAAPGSGTRIWFDLARDGPVSLSVLDLRGRLIRQLIPARPDCGTVTLRAGLYGRAGQVINSGVGEGCALTSWDGRDERGQVAGRGVYVLRLQAGGLTQVRRMLFMPE